MDPYTTAWINQYIGSRFDLGPCSHKYIEAMRAWYMPTQLDFDRVARLNILAQTRPELFAPITTIYGPDVASLVRFLSATEAEFVYKLMTAYVSATFGGSRGNDVLMLNYIQQLAATVCLPNGFNGPLAKYTRVILDKLVAEGELRRI